MTYDPDNRPAVANLITIHSLLTNKSTDQICKECEHLDTGQYKLLLAEVIVEHLAPIREKIENYLKSPEYLYKILDVGAKKAAEIAETTLIEVKNIVGFVDVTESGVKNLKNLARKVS